MIKIEVVQDNNLWEKKIKKPKLFFNKLISFFPNVYQFKKKHTILTLLLSNNNYIKKLNYKFRNKNKPTDVLSFPYHAKKELKKYFKEKKIYLGDIAISYEYIFIKKNKYLSNQKVLIKTFIHGFLHLLGFDHNKIKEFKKMNSTEKKIYNRIISKIDKT